MFFFETTGPSGSKLGRAGKVIVVFFPSEIHHKDMRTQC